MTAEREGLAEIAGVLAEHRLVRDDFSPHCSCGLFRDKRDHDQVNYRTHLADVFADLLAARDRRVRAEALREAADEARRIHDIARTPLNELDEATKDEFRHHPLAEVSGIQPHRITVADWLRARADRTEAAT